MVVELVLLPVLALATLQQLTAAHLVKIQLRFVKRVPRALTEEIANSTVLVKMEELVTKAELETDLVLVRLDISEISAKFSALVLP